MNYYKHETKKICEVKGWDKASVSAVWLLFTEEVGELASAIRQYHHLYKKKYTFHKGTNVVHEMGDVFGYLFQLADMLNIDLDVMWKMHQQKMTKKIYIQY